MDEAAGKAVGNWSPISLGAVGAAPSSRILELDFTDSLADGDTLASLTAWSCSVASGADPTPANRILTPPQLTGNKTEQKFVAPAAALSGVGSATIVYILNASGVTTNGENWNGWSYLAVVPIGACAPAGGC